MKRCARERKEVRVIWGQEEAVVEEKVAGRDGNKLQEKNDSGGCNECREKV